MLVKKPKVSLSEVSQVIDLSEFVSGKLSDSDKISIGQELIDRMTSRVSEGRGLRFDDSGNASNVKLKSPYSKMYVDSLDFQAAGKAKNRVNMSLTGDMLADITVENLSGNKIKLTFNDGIETAKAYNHMVGDTVPQRPFFGVSKSDVKEVSRGFDSVDDTPTRVRLLDLLSALDGDDGDL